MKDFRINTTTITDREDVCVARYLKDISRYSLLTPDDEAKLASIIKKGGEAAERAKERLVQANLRFVVSVANQYKRKNMELSDLIAEGNIGLLKAAQFFDETRGFKFISYAVWWIRQSIISAIGNNSTTLRLPINQQKILNEYRRMDREMMQLEQRHLTIEEFCEVTGALPERVSQALSASNAVVKMDSPLDSDTDTTVADMMESGSRTDMSLETESLKQELAELLSKHLKPREADILRKVYGIGRGEMTMEAVAEEYGLSRERARQICLQSISKLRSTEDAKSIIEYLGRG